MTNNQRFAAELAVLLLVGGAIWSKAAPHQEGNRLPLPDVHTQHLYIDRADGTTCAALEEKEGEARLTLYSGKQSMVIGISPPKDGIFPHSMPMKGTQPILSVPFIEYQYESGSKIPGRSYSLVDTAKGYTRIMKDEAELAKLYASPKNDKH